MAHIINVGKFKKLLSKFDDKDNVCLNCGLYDEYYDFLDIVEDICNCDNDD